MKNQHLPSAKPYQLNKTIRFGLTLKRKLQKNEATPVDIYQSHSILKEEVWQCQQTLESTLKSDLNKQEKEFVSDVRHCISEIKQYLANWKDVHHRKDQISLSKDYYKKLARKACFDWFWYKRDARKQQDIKKPDSSKIDLSSLSNKEQRGDKIVQYWSENIKKIERKIYDFESILKQYETAIAESDKAHTKINLVNFRKMCLAILNITNDVLEPLNDGSIIFEKLNQLTQKQDDKKVEAFVSSDQKQKLLAKIVDIKTYFEANGGYVPFGRVTLNRYTAEQKPENVDKKIDELLKKLHIIPLIKTLQEKSEEEIRQYFQFDKQDKKRIINDGSISDVERIQCFKYKTIPLHVQYGMAAYLEKHQSIPKEATLKVLKSIGMPYNVGEQYQKHLADKDIAFDFHQFPLKVSFDYAWENLARYTQNENANKFPVEQSKQFLKDVFGVDENNVAFKIYAELFALKEKLVTLEYDTNQPKDMEGMIDEVRLMLEKSTALKQVSDYNTHISNINKWITEWFKLDDNKRVEYKKIKQKKLRNGERWFKDIDDIYSAYNQAKNKIGLIRGGQRSKIGEYHKLTEAFKQLSVRVGKSFAELRDKLNEAYQLNKITHYGTIIEDNNQDRYMLLKTINHDAQESLKDIYTNDPNGNIKVYELKSFTSKTLHKIIKNKGAYTDFHTNQKIDYSKIKESWSTYKDDRAFLNWLKERLKNSTMAKDQAWNEFRWNFDNCTTYEQIEKEINIKSYIWRHQKTISIPTIHQAIKDGHILLPIVNQDLTTKDKNPKNQFSKDWLNIFTKDIEHRLHPEFKIMYRHSTPNYPKPQEKRYSHFQMIGHFLYEYIPQDAKYKSVKEQVQTFNNADKQKNVVQDFNLQIKHNLQKNFYVLGIDRGIKQLATLCVLNDKGEIVGGHDVYTKNFNTTTKVWDYTLQEQRNFLDLSNLRAETTPNGEKVLVDLSLIETKPNINKTSTENQQTIRLKQLSYIRKLQYQMQSNRQSVLDFIVKCQTDKNKDNEIKIEDNIQAYIQDLITSYKQGKQYADLPVEKIMAMLLEYKRLIDENREDELKEFQELDASDDLKNGVVANMIGVIVYFLEKYNYKVYISIENLSRAFYAAKDGLNEAYIPNTEDFREQENKVLAGVGTYQFFEIQLLKKLFRIQKDKQNIHLVPPFRSKENYDKIVRHDKKTTKDRYVNYPFGIVHFVDPANTSKRCPVCEATKEAVRTKDVVSCSACSFKTNMTLPERTELIEKYKKTSKNIIYIQDADENAAYSIALKLLKNLNSHSN